MIKSIIWDLDGTLINSYDVITKSLFELTKSLKIEKSKEEIYQYILQSSVNDYLKDLERKTEISFSIIKECYTKTVDLYSNEIKLMDNAKEVLKKLSDLGIQHFMYTHKGISTLALLNSLEIDSYFTEILTSASGFKRKPNPEAVCYLMDKYHLNKEDTYYVGDRRLDVECAQNARIHSILYIYEKGMVEPTGNEDYIIEDLMAIYEVRKKC